MNNNIQLNDLKKNGDLRQSVNSSDDYVDGVVTGAHFYDSFVTTKLVREL